MRGRVEKAQQQAPLPETLKPPETSAICSFLSSSKQAYFQAPKKLNQKGKARAACQFMSLSGGDESEGRKSSTT